MPSIDLMCSMQETSVHWYARTETKNPHQNEVRNDSVISASNIFKLYSLMKKMNSFVAEKNGRSEENGLFS